MHYRTEQKRMSLINAVVCYSIAYKKAGDGDIAQILEKLTDAVFKLEIHRKNHPMLLDIERA